MFCGQFHQVCGLGGGVGHGFLDQQMFAGQEQFAGEGVMGDGGCDDTQGITGRGGVRDAFKGADTEAGRMGAGLFR